MNSSRICINARCLSGPVTGVQRFAREMLGIQPFGAVPEVFSPNIQWARGVRGHIWEQVVLPRHLDVQRDVLISPANMGPFYYPRQILVVHDMATLDVPEAFSRKFALWYRFAFKRLVKNVKFIVTVSEFSKSRIEAWFPDAVGKIGVVPNGVSPFQGNERKANNWDDVREKFAIRSPYLLFVGSMDPRKNLRRLLGAWRKLRLGARWTLYIVGGANAQIFRPEKFHEANDCSVQFLGRVDDIQLTSLYKNASGVICPSVYEGFGLPPLEAINCGCRHVLVSDIPVFREVLGSSANYFQPTSEDDIGRAIRDLVNNRLVGLRAEDALSLTRRFSWDNARASFVRCILEGDLL